MSESDNENDKNYRLPLESADDRFLSSMARARFDPNASIELPSGKVISGEEAQAFMAVFDRPDVGFAADYDPYDMLDAPSVDLYRIDPQLRERAKETVRRADWSNELPNPVYISSRPRNPFIRMYRWLRDLRRR